MGALDYVKDYRIAILIVFIAALAGLDYYHGGLNLGIEFVGGTQIPVMLQHNVTPDNMTSVISTLQQRVSTYGLKEVTVEGIGNSEVYVTVPTVSNTEIQSTINIIESQGIFQGIVNGKEALNGTGIISGGIGAETPVVSNGTVAWAVNFLITQQAAVRFAKVVFGQAYQPLYLYLDRPTQTIVLLNSSLISSSTGLVNQSAYTSALESAVALGNQSIPIQIYSSGAKNWPSIYPYFQDNRVKYNTVIVARNTPSFVIQNLTALNYTVRSVSLLNDTPVFIAGTSAPGVSPLIVTSWPAIGLLDSPQLNPSVTNGTIGQSYEISGYAPSNLSLVEKEAYATNQSTTIVSILSGGALPVPVIVGSPTTIPPTLGKQFEYTSGVAAIAAIIAVSIVVTIRYRKLFLIAPILLTTLAELFIIVSIIGLVGTIDLAAVAGMIAVVGTGVDAQIIITDEIVAGAGATAATAKMRLGRAFYIVWADAALLIVAMLPLLFSTSLVDIIGFSESTILGALLGVLITRPAYGAIVSKRFAKGEEQHA